MNQLSTEDRVRIISCLIEGNSQRATCRMTGAAKKTVARLAVEIGEACERFADTAMHNLPCERIQCDGFSIRFRALGMGGSMTFEQDAKGKRSVATAKDFRFIAPGQTSSFLAAMPTLPLQTPYVEGLAEGETDLWDCIQPVIHATAQTEIRRGDLVAFNVPSTIDAARQHLATKLGVPAERLVFDGFTESKEFTRKLKGSFTYHPPIMPNA